MTPESVRVAAGVPETVPAGSGPTVWRRDLRLSLPILSGLRVLLLSACTAAAAGAGYRAGGVPAAILAGGGGAVLASSVAAAAAHGLARSLRTLQTEALRRLADPTAPVRRHGSVAGAPATELTDLARTLEALHLRVQVADQVAQRHRDSAETASLGMFELLSGLVAAEEATRGQLAAELHDTVAQSLMLARSALASPRTPPVVARVAELVEEAEEALRAAMARARPPALRDGDLARAVAGLGDDLAARYGLSVRIDWPAVPHPMPLVTAVTVYRFFQEALLNVVKHADVDEARAALAVCDGAVTAVVSDAGPGFDPERVASAQGRHVGLGLLRERARLAGGSLQVRSWPYDGSSLTLRLPLAVAVPAQRAPAERAAVPTR